MIGTAVPGTSDDRALEQWRDAARVASGRFADGSAWKIEIPSVEGPAALAAVIDEARIRAVPVARVSQGSGIVLLTRTELKNMAELGQAHAIEVVLWAGPRAGWDIGVQARSSMGAIAQAAVRGSSGLRLGVSEAIRAAEVGIAGVLVADLGLLATLGRAKEQGILPPSFVLKVSVSLPITNSATAGVLVELGATTLNLPVDLPLTDIAGIRAAIGPAVPLDCYIEGPDDFGGALRYHELADLVAVAAPVHIKFTVRNGVGLYPFGGHLEQQAVATSRERVRRAALALELLDPALGNPSNGRS